MINDFSGKVVLVTGGTSGIGLETALVFGERGARCVLTYLWGSADEDAVRRRFGERGAPEPLLIRADVGDPADTDLLVGRIADELGGVDVFISNAATAALVRDLDDLSERALTRSIAASAWPMVGHVLKIGEVCGRYPRYVVGMSSTGPDHFTLNYDFVAASKAVMETLCRYLTYRLRHEDVHINVLRSRSVRTPAFEEVFGEELTGFTRRFVSDDHYVEPVDVAHAAFALCSGLLDGVRGQVVTADRGTTFSDNLMRIFAERDALPL